MLTYVDIADSPEDPDPASPGWIIYMAVEDNGEGLKSDTDRYHDKQWFAPVPIPACEFLGPTIQFWWPEDEWFDVVEKNDFIQIK